MSLLRSIALGAPLLFGIAAVHGAPDLPKRQPGLWEMTTNMPQMGGLAMTVQTCVDSTTDELMAKQGDEAQICEKRDYRRDGDRVVFEATCKTDGSTVHVKGVFSGNFAHSYKGKIDSTYTPPIHGMASSSMTMEGRWLGACKPGQKPGDTQMMGMPGMGNINIQEMMKNMPKNPN
ncbi:MAG: DUF3617 family protein [Rhodocyclales bacterium]|nr:DUF3617 family protein [Rhodocyclales bacterium]